MSASAPDLSRMRDKSPTLRRWVPVVGRTLLHRPLTSQNPNPNAMRSDRAAGVSRDPDAAEHSAGVT
jgi:hypothetical protein